MQRRAGRGLQLAGRSLELAGRALETAEGASEPAGRAMEPAWRAPEPAGRVSEQARWALEPAVRPRASWEGQLRGLGEDKEKKRQTERENGAFVVCGGTIGRCPKTICTFSWIDGFLNRNWSWSFFFYLRPK